MNDAWRLEERDSGVWAVSRWDREYGPWDDTGQAETGVVRLAEWTAENLAPLDDDRVVLLYAGLATRSDPSDQDRLVCQLAGDHLAGPGDGLMNPQPVMKAAEKRYTFAPVYAPGRTDADGQTTTPDELQQAVWSFNAFGDRRLLFWHLDVTAGHIVEMCTWPKAAKWEMAQPDGSTRTVTLPVGTAYMGAVWETWSWALVKAGKIGGYSMGGSSVPVPLKDVA